jgi:hypothetical protein
MKQPTEYLQREGVVAFAIIHPEGDTSASRAGETDLAILRATDGIARLSIDGCAMAIAGNTTYRSRYVKGVGSVAMCHETGTPIAKSANRMVDRALRAMASRAEDDEPTRVYHPGAAALMTPANDLPATP